MLSQEIIKLADKIAFDMSLTVQQFSPYIKDYENFFKSKFKIAARWNKSGGYLKDGNRLRVQFRTKNLEGFTIHIGYNKGQDLYMVETNYYNEGGVHLIKDIKGIYFDQFEDPDIFFPVSKTKDIIKEAQKKIKSIEQDKSMGEYIKPKDFISKIKSKYKTDTQGRNGLIIELDDKKKMLIYRHILQGIAHWIPNTFIYQSGKPAVQVDMRQISKKVLSETEEGWKNLQQLVKDINKLAKKMEE